MSDSLTWTFQVDEPPQRAYDAINDVRGWWSAQITGRTDQLNAEFSYWVPGIHYVKFRITELVPGSKVSWLTLDSWLAFPDDKEEWTGTTVTFDITEVDGGTEVRFTHEGLVPEVECYDVCWVAWGGYITGSLHDLITTGAGQPNSSEGPEALAQVRAALAERPLDDAVTGSTL
jgi:uncharacterized protein YndB with AHSA1/START domain